MRNILTDALRNSPIVQRSNIATPRLYRLLSAVDAPELPGMLRGRWADTFRTSWIGDVKTSRSTTVRSLIEQQPRFRIEGTGALSSRAIIGETRAASELLHGRNGARLERALRGYLGVLDAQSGSTTVHNIAFSTSSRGFAVNSMLNIYEGTSGARLRIPGTRDNAVATEIRKAIREDGALWPLRLGGANHEEGRITLGTAISKQFLSLVEEKGLARIPYEGKRRSRNASYILMHEGQHAVTPIISQSDMKMMRFEEALADVITRWEGVTAELRSKLGFPQTTASAQDWVTQPLQGYARYAANMRGILELAGINTSGRAGLADARALLQNQDAAATPIQIARTMIAHNNLSGVDETVLAGQIVDAAIDRKALRAMKQELGISESVSDRMHRAVLLRSARHPLVAAGIGGSAMLGYQTGNKTQGRVRGGNFVPRPLDAASGALFTLIGVAGLRMHEPRMVIPAALYGAGLVVGGSVGAVAG